MINRMFDKTKPAGFQEPLSDEENMKSDILSQEEIVYAVGQLFGAYKAEQNAVAKSHAALLNRVAELEHEITVTLRRCISEKDTEISELEGKVAELEKRDSEQNNRLSEYYFSEQDYEKQIAELEEDIKRLQKGKQSALETVNSLQIKHMELKEKHQILIDDFHRLEQRFEESKTELANWKEYTWQNKTKMGNKIIELEKQLADKKPKRKGAYDVAKGAAKKLHRTLDASLLFEHDDYFEVVWLDGLGYRKEKKFPYSVPREPQVGDLMINDKTPFFIKRVDGNFYRSTENWDFVIKNSKPSGYRWDTETESIRPIEEGE